MAPIGLPFSAAAQRNAAPILAALQAVLPPRAVVLEIASGTGQHATHFAAARPGWAWQPSDAEAASLPHVAARTAALANVRPPLHLDVLHEPWPEAIGRVDAVYAANLLHISPWPTCAALMRGAAARLTPDGVLVVYGPFVVDGEPLAPSNAAFDADLRRRDPAWGLRTLASVTGEAARAGLALRERRPMPANNLLLVFGLAPPGSEPLPP